MSDLRTLMIVKLLDNFIVKSEFSDQTREHYRQRITVLTDQALLEEYDLVTREDVRRTDEWAGY